MKRFIEEFLIKWKKETKRKPLLIRGARQIGKTYTIKKFAKENFQNLIYVNLEQNFELIDLFKSLKPKEIIEKLSLFYNEKIEPERSLIFIDEIQKSLDAIVTLRYFYEDIPDLHVIACGSLLDFTLNSEHLSMPVGRIQNIYFYPMTFMEFLLAQKENMLFDFLNNWDFKLIEGVIHDKLVKIYRKFLLIGGMPEAVKEYSESQNFSKVIEIHNSICSTYKDDFGKYANLAKHGMLEKLFYSVPKLTGQKFKYVNVDENALARDVKSAFELLEKARVIYKIKKTIFKLPLEAGTNDKHFKSIFLDVGLMQNICSLGRQILSDTKLNLINSGSIAEQVVGQELLAINSPILEGSLYYWFRDAKNSQAEIDYLTNYEEIIVPIEVKSSLSNKAKSLKIFLDENGIKFGVKISEEVFNVRGNIISLPFYLLHKLKEVVFKYF